MQTMKYVLVIMLLIGSSPAWAAKPIQNIVDEPVPQRSDGTPRTLDEVRNAIIEGCQYKGWQPKADGESQMQCSILVRGQHYAEVVIPYSETSYSIMYSDSRVLDYDEERQRIHRNYNKWVILLSRAIQLQFDMT